MSDAEIDCWKARIVLPKSEAHALAARLEEIEPVPVVSAFETGERDLWEVEAFFSDAPDPQKLLSIAGVEMKISAIPKADWVTISLDGIPPVSAGRFFIHGRHTKSLRPQNAIGLEIEASTAFGTGHHGTTRGCLLAFEKLAREGRLRRVLDLGCGTGVLAFAAAKLMQARTVATDIDRVASDKAAEFARANGVHPFVRTAQAAGFQSATIRDGGPYDLIFANILMKPLMRLMPGISSHLKTGGHAILSGLLVQQEHAIMAYATACGLRLKSRIRLDGWVTLTLRKS